jgi:hypothetical protein
MASIHFETDMFSIGSWTILLFPRSVSAQLPSRGLALVEGTMNGIPFRKALEPDGRGSHWFRVDEPLCKAAHTGAGQTVTLTIKSSKNWPEPDLPDDLTMALQSKPLANSQWREITPLARWDWIRWIVSTENQETRQKRIIVTCDKLGKGHRRPCCFNRNLCTETKVSQKGLLLVPTVLDE